MCWRLRLLPQEPTGVQCFAAAAHGGTQDGESVSAAGPPGVRVQRGGLGHHRSGGGKAASKVGVVRGCGCAQGVCHCRNTVKGKKFVVWRLSDLSSQSAVVGLFLFGAAYEAHWKTAQGSVVALLNARLLPASEVSRPAAPGASAAVCVCVCAERIGHGLGSGQPSEAHAVGYLSGLHLLQGSLQEWTDVLKLCQAVGWRLL